MRVQALTLLFASTLMVMSGAAVAPALPAIFERFQNVPNAIWMVKLILSIPALTIALSSPFIGYIVDRWGRKRVLIISTAFYVIAGTSGAILDSLFAILISRGLLGIAVAGITTSATTLIADYFIGDKRNLIMGLQGTWMALGGTIYLSVGGLLGDINWRAPFLLYATAVVIIPLMIKVIHEPTAKAGDIGVLDPSEGKLPFNVAISAYVLGFSGMMVFYILPVQLPFYLLELLGAGSILAGFALGFLNLINGGVSAFYRGVKRRFSYQTIFIMGIFTMGIGLVAVYFANSYVSILVAMAIFGAGFGLYFPNVTVWLVSNTPKHLRGRAVGGLTTSIFLGLFVSPIVGHLLGQEVGLDNAYALAGVFLIGVAVLIALFSLSRLFFHKGKSA